MVGYVVVPAGPLVSSHHTELLDVAADRAAGGVAPEPDGHVLLGGGDTGEAADVIDTELRRLVRVPDVPQLDCPSHVVPAAEVHVLHRDLGLGRVGPVRDQLLVDPERDTDPQTGVHQLEAEGITRIISREASEVSS